MRPAKRDGWSWTLTSLPCLGGQATSLHSHPRQKVRGPLQWLGWRPLLLVCVALVLGVAVADLLPKTATTALALAAVAAVLFVLSWIGPVPVRHIALVAAAFVAGSCWAIARWTPAPRDISRFAPSKPKTMAAVVEYKSLGGRWAVCRAVDVVYDDGHRRPAVGWFCLKARRGWELPVGAKILLRGPVLLRPWRPRTNPFQRSRALSWGRRGIWCYAKPRGVKILRRPKSKAIDDLAAEWRDALTRRLELAMPGRQPERAAHLLAAIIYGAPLSDLPQDLVELYRHTGTIHVLVVSGSQVTFLVLVLLLATGRRRRPAQLYQLVLVLPATFFYATLCGKEPSVLRAAALATVLVVGKYGGRRYDIATALALVAAALVLAEPADLFAPGLQLTFAACLGVIGAAALVPPIELARRPQGPPSRHKTPAYLRVAETALRAVVYTLACTVGAWLMTVPVLAYHFGGVAVVGNLANAVVVPAAEAALLVGVPGLALAVAHPLLATVPLWLARLLIDLSILVNTACARLPGAYLDGVRMGLGTAVAWYIAVLSIYVLARYSSLRLRVAWAAAAIAVAALMLLAASTPPAIAAPTVTWLDVGEGLCTVIEVPGRMFALFDAGSRDPDLQAYMARHVLVPYLQARGCKCIAAAVVSHADVDHFNAVPTVMERFEVRRLIIPPWGEGERYEDLIREARWRAIDISVARAGASLRLGPLLIRFLHPQNYPVTDTRSPDNDNCLVARVEANGRAVLLTADVEAAGQREILQNLGAAAVAAQVLQVPHHGRRGAFWQPFVDAVSPRLAVVPCGPLYTGARPDLDFLAYLRTRGARVLETSRWGAVTVALAPSGLRVHTFLRRPRQEPVPTLAPPVRK